MARSYEDLVVWQRAMELATHIDDDTQAFPKTEMFGLTAQLRRAAVSVASNIAEGKGRSDRDFALFLMQARGSIWELETQIELSRRLHFLADKRAAAIREDLSIIGKMLSALIGTMRAAA